MSEHTIRSFVLRQGRLTRGQQQALAHYWGKYGLDAGGRFMDLDIVFGRQAPRVLEIGFGSGESLVQMAVAQPETDFLGIEVHRPGIGHLLMMLERDAIDNVRVIRADAVEIMKQQLADNSLDRVQLYFPDPWPKRRHHKRRIVQLNWVRLVARKLKPGGCLHMATDWEPYAHQMMQVMSADTQFSNAAGAWRFSPRPEYRPTTRFEQRGQRQGHGVLDLIFERI
jgi:tRNA (guanine-N7-)-methyltransferase